MRRRLRRALGSPPTPRGHDDSSRIPPPAPAVRPSHRRRARRARERARGPLRGRGRDGPLRVRDAENRFLFVVRKGVGAARARRTDDRALRGGRAVRRAPRRSAAAARASTRWPPRRRCSTASRSRRCVRCSPTERVATFFFESLADRLRVSSARESAALPTDFTAAARTAVHRQPLFVDPETPVAEAARRMSAEHVSSVLVGDHQLGILTDRDLRSRVVARGLDPQTPVRAVMTRPCRTAPASATLFEVLLEMLEHRIHHVPLVDRGEVVGVVTQTDLLRQTTRSPLHLLKSVERHGDTSRLSDFAAEQAAMVERLAAGGLEATRIGRIAASVNDALVAPPAAHGGARARRAALPLRLDGVRLGGPVRADAADRPGQRPRLPRRHARGEGLLRPARRAHGRRAARARLSALPGRLHGDPLVPPAGGLEGEVRGLDRDAGARGAARRRQLLRLPPRPRRAVARAARRDRRGRPRRAALPAPAGPELAPLPAAARLPEPGPRARRAASISRAAG